MYVALGGTMYAALGGHALGGNMYVALGGHVCCISVYSIRGDMHYLKGVGPSGLEGWSARCTYRPLIPW